jgi:hypothetical protein
VRDVLIGTTDYTVLVKILLTTGAPATGLTEASIDIAYSRVETDNDVTTADVTPAALSALTDAHTDWGFEEVSSTDHAGLYRLDIADAVFASGAWEAVVTITDASGTDFYAVDIGFRLVAFNPIDGVRLGLTALPNAAADAAGGLPISDAGGLDLDAQIGTKINDILTDTGITLQGELDGIQADTEDIQSRLPAALQSGKIDASVSNITSSALAQFFTVDSGSTDGDAVAGSVVKETADKVWNSSNTGWSVATMGEAVLGYATQLNSILTKLFGITSLANWLRAIARKGNNDATAVSEINANNGTGTGTFDPTADSEEAIRDRGDAAWTTATGFSTLSQSDVRSAVGLASANLDDQLSTIDSVADAILLDTAEIGTAGAGLTEAGGTGDQFTAIPWNASWDTEVQSEAADALIAYDPPTKAELDSAVAGLAVPGSAMTLTSGERDAVATALLDLANGIESGETLRQFCRLIRAVLIQTDDITSGDTDAGTIVFKRKDGSTTALTVVYSNGERTSVTVGTV